MSTRPRYYTGSAFAARPIIFVGVASYFWYRGGSRRDCSEDFPGEERFQYGRQCRKCSSWACPIGQHRESCTPQSDSYCKPCTNKPDGNYVYTTPGNANDCESTPCTTDEAIYLEQDIPLCDGVYSSDFDSAEFCGLGGQGCVLCRNSRGQRTRSTRLGANTRRLFLKFLAPLSPLARSRQWSEDRVRIERG